MPDDEGNSNQTTDPAPANGTITRTPAKNGESGRKELGSEGVVDIGRTRFAYDEDTMRPGADSGQLGDAKVGGVKEGLRVTEAAVPPEKIAYDIVKGAAQGLTPVEGVIKVPMDAIEASSKGRIDLISLHLALGSLAEKEELIFHTGSREVLLSVGGTENSPKSVEIQVALKNKIEENLTRKLGESKATNNIIQSIFSNVGLRAAKLRDADNLTASRRIPQVFAMDEVLHSVADAQTQLVKSGFDAVKSSYIVHRILSYAMKNYKDAATTPEAVCADIAKGAQLVIEFNKTSKEAQEALGKVNGAASYVGEVLLDKIAEMRVPIANNTNTLEGTNIRVAGLNGDITILKSTTAFAKEVVESSAGIESTPESKEMFREVGSHALHLVLTGNNNGLVAYTQKIGPLARLYATYENAIVEVQEFSQGTRFVELGQLLGAELGARAGSIINGGAKLAKIDDIEKAKQFAVGVELMIFPLEKALAPLDLLFEEGHFHDLAMDAAHSLKQHVKAAMRNGIDANHTIESLTKINEKLNKTAQEIYRDWNVSLEKLRLLQPAANQQTQFDEMVPAVQARLNVLAGRSAMPDPQTGYVTLHDLEQIKAEIAAIIELLNKTVEFNAKIKQMTMSGPSWSKAGVEIPLHISKLAASGIGSLEDVEKTRKRIEALDNCNMLQGLSILLLKCSTSGLSDEQSRIVASKLFRYTAPRIESGRINPDNALGKIDDLNNLLMSAAMAAKEFSEKTGKNGHSFEAVLDFIFAVSVKRSLKPDEVKALCSDTKSMLIDVEKKASALKGQKKIFEAHKPSGSLMTPQLEATLSESARSIDEQLSRVSGITEHMIAMFEIFGRNYDDESEKLVPLSPVKGELANRMVIALNRSGNSLKRRSALTAYINDRAQRDMPSEDREKEIVVRVETLEKVNRLRTRYPQKKKEKPQKPVVAAQKPEPEKKSWNPFAKKKVATPAKLRKE